MLYLIGLGLSGNLTCNALESMRQADKIYLESYTMPWNYDEVKGKLEHKHSLEISLIDRSKVESNFLIKEAKVKDIALLIGGDIFSATTHISLYSDSLKSGVKVKCFHNSSIFSAISKTGLSIYKFGQTVTLSFWRDNYKPTSPIFKIKKNFDNSMHTLVLLDIDKELGFMDSVYAMKLLKEMENKENIHFIKEVLSISRLGFYDEKIVFSTIDSLLKQKATLGSPPFSLVIPSKLSEYEKEFLSLYSLK